MQNKEKGLVEKEIKTSSYSINHKKYYESNPKRQMERNKKWKEAHPDYYRNYYLNHKDRYKNKKENKNKGGENGR